MVLCRVVTPFRVTRPLAPEELAAVEAAGRAEHASPVMGQESFFCDSTEDVEGWGPRALARASDQAEQWIREAISRATASDPVGLELIEDRRAARLVAPCFADLDDEDSPNVEEDEGLRVELDASGGCTLQITTRSQVAVVHASGIYDAFSDLVDAVAATSAGALISTCLWGGEPGGFFLDFSRTPSAGCGLVIHDMEHDGWHASSPQDPWNAERGAARFAVNCDEDVWRRTFARAFTRLRESTPATDSSLIDVERAITSLTSGFVPSWNRRA